MAYQPKSYRKFVATAATATLVASAVAPAASAAGLSDIDNHRHEDAIKNLVEKEIISGYPDGTFRPDTTITRAEGAIMIARALGILGEGETPETDFSDVHEMTQAYEAIVKLEEKGIISGYPDGTYRPDESITREAIAKYLVLAFQDRFEDADGDGTKFTDVSGDSALGKYVEQLLNAGVTEGVNETQFGSKQEMKRGDFAAFTHRTLELEEKVVVPEVVGVSAIADNQVELTFSTEVSEDTTEDNFSVSDRTVTGVEVNGKTVVLTLNSALADGTEYEVTAADVYNANNTEKLDSYTGTVTYQVADVEDVTINKTDFRANVGTKITNYVTVKDSDGKVVSIEDYQVTAVESKNTTIVEETNGEVLNPGTTEVRVKVEYKNGETIWSDWTEVSVEGVTVSDDATYGFVDSVGDIPENEVEFAANAKDYLYSDGDSETLVLFKNYANGDSMGRHVDLGSDSLDNVTITNNTTTLIDVTQDAEGSLTVSSLQNGKTGTASITVKGEIEGQSFTNELTFEVKASPAATSISSLDKVTLLPNKLAGTTDTNLADKAAIQGALDDGTFEEGVDQYTLPLFTHGLVEGVILDQYDEDYALVQYTGAAINTPNSSNGQAQWTLTTQDHGNDDKAGKFVVSIPESSYDKIIADGGDIRINGSGDLVVQAPSEIAVPQFDVTVTYFADADSTEKTYETTLPVEIVETDGEVASFEIEADEDILDASDLDQDQVTFTASAVDEDGNVLTYNANKLLLANVDGAETLTDSEDKYTDFDSLSNTAGADGETGVTAGFDTGANPDLYYAGDESTKIKVAVGDSTSTVYATEIFTINLTNSNPVPTSVELPTEVTVDLSDATAAKGSAPALLDLLNGSIAESELVVDKFDNDLSDDTEDGSNFAIAPKADLDGYVDGLEPMLKVYDKDGNAVPFGANAYGIDNFASDADALTYDFDYATAPNKLEFLANDVTIANADEGILIGSTDATQKSTLALADFNAQITLASGVEKASLTFIVGEYGLKNGSAIENDLIDGKHTVRVTFVK
ncbi:S-layer homology domain-containing protein [Bacillus seohaeanensis]|uniref:S-layer homology domain-containing protein n=1 Tax=Bacillus seohaeanensis TaxID=284580 RepID=A0ABW5RWL5_9BACI